MLFFFPRDVLDEIWYLIVSVSEGFPTYCKEIVVGTRIKTHERSYFFVNFIFLLIGHDTTASSIMWTLYSLAKYPDMQDKVREDIQDVLQGRTRLEV